MQNIQFVGLLIDGGIICQLKDMMYRQVGGTCP
jgi:hypothetical protein